jgi:hypothetical protein
MITTKNTKTKTVKVIKVKDTFKVIKLRINAVNDIRNIQGQSGNWNYDEYMLGLYNGFEFASSILENREPKFRGKPKGGWLKDKKCTLTKCCEPVVDKQKKSTKVTKSNKPKKKVTK